MHVVHIGNMESFLPGCTCAADELMEYVDELHYLRLIYPLVIPCTHWAESETMDVLELAYKYAELPIVLRFRAVAESWSREALIAILVPKCVGMRTEDGEVLL